MYNIDNIELFDDSIEDFIKEIWKITAFITIKDKKYLNWRYCDEREEIL